MLHVLINEVKFAYRGLNPCQELEIEWREERKAREPQGKDLETGISLMCSRNGEQPHVAGVERRS